MTNYNRFGFGGVMGIQYATKSSSGFNFSVQQNIGTENEDYLVASVSVSR